MTESKNTCSSSLACFVLPTNALTPTLFSLRAVPLPQAGEGFPFISTAIKCWVDTYSRLTGPVMTPLGEPSIYAAWRAQYLCRLARTQYLRRLGYNALSSLIIL